MLDSQVYSQRRRNLKKQVGSGVILFLGSEESPMNYPANPYHFRQDSSFLYFFGLDSPGLAGIIDVDNDLDVLYGNDVEVEDIIWMGAQPLLKDRALIVGVTSTAPAADLDSVLHTAVGQGRKIHFLPPYRADSQMKLGQLLGIRPERIRNYVSEALVKAVVEQRSVKNEAEIAEMEWAHEVTYDIYTAAMRMARPGIYEQELVGRMEGIALEKGAHMAFPTILSINGQILHNHFHGNTLKEGRLIVCDAGVESPLHYASDITRTFPVSGSFSPVQKDIYSLVLGAQIAAIEAIKPGVMYKEIHLKSAGIIASGLKDLGLMKGDVEAAVSAGAHGLFFPHGLGHQIGLDVHDMEDLGENHVGYDETINRSDQFGLAYLRLAKELQPGFVLTVEPGIYFIPALIDKWVAEKKHPEYIDYDRVNRYRDFGGVRIEDDVLVTENGFRVLGKSIPKTVAEVEAVTGKG